MTAWTIIRRSLRYHVRSHFGVVLGAAVGSAALIGALGVGDSVRASLRQGALERLGTIHFALNGGERFFRRTLAETSPMQVALLALPGTAARQDGSARANRVMILGVDETNWPGFAGWTNDSRNSRLGNGRHEGTPLPSPLPFSRGEGGAPMDSTVSEASLKEWRAGETALLNQTLARQLAVREGDEIVLRIRRPTALAQDTVLSPRDENSLALRLRVGPLLSAEQLGNFSLAANQKRSANAFLPLDFLAQKTGLKGRANLLVKSGVESKERQVTRDKAKTSPEAKDLEMLSAGLKAAFELEDAQLNLEIVKPLNADGDPAGVAPTIQLSSSRIFLETQIVAAAQAPEVGPNQSKDAKRLSANQGGGGILTYLANLIHAGEHATPYSMVTAAGPPYVPADLGDEEILVNEWLAEDLQIHPGDRLAMSYYLVDSGSRLVERTNTFRVRGVVPLKGIYGDRSLMPEFPGLAKAESTHDWDAGFKLVYPIREKDEAYWKQHRGTPKAFIALAAGQKMWANRFGSLTAIRYPVPDGTPAAAVQDAIRRSIRARLSPAEVGLHWEPVREEALKAAEQSQDFGQLFLGFSVFLVTAAILLMGMLFQFGLEQRASEVGTLLALGFTAKQVRRWFLAEATILTALGGLTGALGGIGYTKAMLWGLRTVWKNAVANAPLEFDVTWTTWVSGLSASVIVASGAIWLTSRKQARQPVMALLSGEPQVNKAARRPGKAWAGWLAGGAGLGAAASLGWALSSGEIANAEAFFSGGALLLVSGLALSSVWLGRLARRKEPSGLSLGSLGVRSCARRQKRSVATIALLASGSFLIASIGVFRLDASREEARHSSGTGGFALLGETTLPVVQDLNTQTGREHFGLAADDMAGVTVVPFRVQEGDEASCLNLNHPQKPRLLGVAPAPLSNRFTFAREAATADRRKGWALLSESGSAAEIPAIGDANSLEWALGKKVGDTIDYTDERGQPFKLRLVGALANSILQGSLIIDESAFLRRFPSQSGYRLFLMDAPREKGRQLSRNLSRAMQDVGLELTPAVERLETLNAVQNTYLGTFQILGGLGLLLGSAGLGVVVLRNVLERRGELALLMAVGFRKRLLHRMILAEHGALLGLGLGLGVGAAAVAVLPNLLLPGSRLPWQSLSVTLGAVAVNALLWTWLATRWSLRGNLLAGLRNE